MRIFSLILLYVGCATLLFAAEPLKKPLRFIPTDSVVCWDEDWCNLQQTAIRSGVNGRSYPLDIAPMKRKALRQLAEQWDNTMAAQFDLTGALIGVPAGEQAYAAVRTVETSARLLALTGQAHYAEPLERLAFNLLPRLALDSTDAPGRHMSGRLLLSLVGTTYAADDEGVFINFYTNSFARTTVGTRSVSIDMVTAMPHDARIKLRIGLSRGTQRMKVRLRLPHWACRQAFPASAYTGDEPTGPCPEIFVNGRSEQLPIEQGYIVIDRYWNNGDEVYLDFPFSPLCLRSLRPAESSNPIAIQRGPLLYVPFAGSPTAPTLTPESLTEADEPGPLGHTVLVEKTTDITPNDTPLLLLPYVDAAMIR